MSQLTAREPGVVGAALDDPESWCGIIVDGRHVDPAVLRIALRCKRRDRFMLVTDAMPSVGAAEKSFSLQGRTISVADGVLVDEDGTLAGSDTDMATTVRNAVELLGVELPEAARMASRYPAEFLGLGSELGRIAPGYRANLVLVDDDVAVRETWIDGRLTASLKPRDQEIPDPLRRFGRKFRQYAAPVFRYVPEVRVARAKHVMVEQAGPGLPQLGRHRPHVQQAVQQAIHPRRRPLDRPERAGPPVVDEDVEPCVERLHVVPPQRGNEDCVAGTELGGAGRGERVLEPGKFPEIRQRRTAPCSSRRRWARSRADRRTGWRPVPAETA